jgi:4-diphosphocytidyl-2-C-methyl-D-erythritol kinase
MPDSVRVLARAKINLYLKIGDRRPDGYHDLETVFHSISLADRVDISLTARGIALAGMLDVPPEQNLAVRAARALLARVGREGQGLAIRLEKSIPMAAGLGGGSADAAAVLVGLNALLGSPLGEVELRTLAASLGADVPFCVRGGMAEARGIGEQLTAHEPLEFALLLVHPPVPVSTAWAYGALDARALPPIAGSAAAVVERARREGAAALAGHAANAFEPVVFREHPAIARARDAVRNAGARWALLAGSGSAVFGVFADSAAAEAAADRVRAALPSDHHVTACASAPRGAEVVR